MIKINWNDKRWLRKSGSQRFEELCYDLLSFENFDNLEWREGSYDGGRDIQGVKVEIQADGSKILERYWFQCKRYKKGIGVAHINVSLRLAENDKADYFVIMTTSHLTPPLQDYINKYNTSHHLKILRFDHKKIEELIIKNAKKIYFLEKYFEEDLQYENLLKKLRKKEEDQIEKLIKSKEGLIKKLISKEYDDKYAYKEILSLSNQYLRLRFNKDALDIIRDSEKFVTETKIKQKLKIETGKIYMQLSRGESAKSIFSDLIRQKKDINDSKVINLLEFYLAKSLFLCFDYNNSFNLFKKLKKYFISQKNKISEEYILAYTDLLIEMNNYKEARRYLKLLRNEANRPNLLILHKELKICNKERNWNKVEKLYKSIKRADKKNSYFWIKIYYEFAYAFWKMSKIKQAIKILEEDSLSLINRSGNEEDLMILFQNLSKLKMEEEPFSQSSWNYYDKWLDISEKIRNKYHNGVVKGLYSSEYLVERKFPDSWESLLQSQRIFESIYSWLNIEQNYNRFGILFQHSGNYLDALKYYVTVGNENSIKNVSKIVIEYYDRNKINFFVENQFSIKKYFSAEKIGLCYLIKDMAEVLTEENFKKAFKLLLRFANDKFSTSKELDIQRPALKALLSIMYLLSQKEKFDVYSLVKSLYKSDIFWDVKEMLTRMLSEIDDYSFITYISKEIKYWGEKYLNEKKLPNQVLHNLENLLFLLATVDLNKYGKDVRNVFNQSTKFGNVEVAHKLKVLNSDQVEQYVNHTINVIKNSIKIENNIPIDAPIEMKGYMIHRSYIEKNKKITVGLLGGLFPPELMNNYEIKSSTIDNYILTIISAVKNKYNMLVNRELLIGLLSFIKIPDHLVEEIYQLLVLVLEKKLVFTEADLKDMRDNANPFARGKISLGSLEKIVMNAIYISAEKFELFKANQKEYLLGKINEYSTDDSEEIRVACAYSFKFFEVKKLEVFLIYYNLLNNHSDNVVGNAIYALRESNPAIWTNQFYIQAINQIFKNIPNYRSIISKRASAKLLGQLNAQKTLVKYALLKNELKGLINFLKDDKFYSVRKELENI